MREYDELLKQAEGLINGEPDRMANLSNLAALLWQTHGFFWVGFYLVKGDELVLGPFQGPVACTRIAKGKGVCGTAWEQVSTQLVPDVHAFPGHIACNAASLSEVVVPVVVDGEVVMVLDLDSDRPDDFDHQDVQGLEALCRIIAAAYPEWKD